MWHSLSSVAVIGDNYWFVRFWKIKKENYRIEGLITIVGIRPTFPNWAHDVIIQIEVPYLLFAALTAPTLAEQKLWGQVKLSLGN